MNNLLGIIVSFAYIFFIITISKKVEKFGKEASRKFIHIMLGFWWIIAMIFFNNVIWAAVMPTIFIVINYLSYKNKLIKVMEREEEEGLGTVYYVISLLILVIISFGVFNKPILSLIPVLVMAIGDGLAAVIGKKVKSPTYKIGDSQKSLIGSSVMFTISFLLIAIYLCQIGISLWLFKSLVMSIIITLIEAISIKGTDNITVPIITQIMIILVVC